MGPPHPDVQHWREDDMLSPPHPLPAGWDSGLHHAPHHIWEGTHWFDEDVTSGAAGRRPGTQKPGATGPAAFRDGLTLFDKRGGAGGRQGKEKEETG